MNEVRERIREVLREYRNDIKEHPGTIYSTEYPTVRILSIILEEVEGVEVENPCTTCEYNYRNTTPGCADHNKCYQLRDWHTSQATKEALKRRLGDE